MFCHFCHINVETMKPGGVVKKLKENTQIWLKIV